MQTATAPQARRWLDRDFRWRGTDVSRMEAFADAVFAIVLALLFLQTKVPANFGELKAAMKGLLPFGVTFVLLAMVWLDHHRFFRRYGLRDRTTMFGNLALLFLVLVYAYPLKFLFTALAVQWLGPIGEMTPAAIAVGSIAGDEYRLLVFYGIGFGAIYLTLTMLYWHALRRAGDLQLDDVERHDTVSSMLECGVLLGFAMLSATLALLRIGPPALAGFIYFGICPSMAVLGWRRGVGHARLVAARIEK